LKLSSIQAFSSMIDAGMSCDAGAAFDIMAGQIGSPSRHNDRAIIVLCENLIRLGSRIVG
jgi:hypothetical protein